MADLGRVGPVYGRWVWPFKHLQIGDEFHVRYEDRHPEDARALAFVRASQLGIKIETEKDDGEGVLRIRRVERSNEKMLPKRLEYSQVDALLQRQYDIEANDVLWHRAMKAGDEVWHPAERINPDEREAIQAKVGDQRFHVLLRPDGILVTLTKEAQASIPEPTPTQSELEEEKRNLFPMPSTVRAPSMQELMS